MKTHTIKTPTAELLIVELPEGSEPLGLIGNSFFYYEKDMVKEDYPKSLTLATSYTLLGKPDEIREEDAKELVYQDDGEFADYKHDANWFSTATESLLSLLETEIYWENPYREKIFVNMDISASMVRAANREIYSEKWHEAEQKIFNRNRSIIFKKKI